MIPTPRLIGLAMLATTLAVDQVNKLWLIFVYGIEARQPLRLAPFFDVIYAKNTGISYSLLRAETEVERIGLLSFTLIATFLLAIWLWRSRTILVAVALGLIVGGALGNAYDRFAYGFVADFYHFHLGSFSWYVFNLADVAIVVGVGLLLYDSLFVDHGTPQAEHAAGE
jgi:signal peptidase II